MSLVRFSWIGKDDAPPILRDIFAKCIKSLDTTTKGVVLVVPGLKPVRQGRRRLAGRKSPLGEIVDDAPGGKSQIVSFKALDVLAWMVANGFCTAEDLQPTT